MDFWAIVITISIVIALGSHLLLAIVVPTSLDEQNLANAEEIDDDIPEEWIYIVDTIERTGKFRHRTRLDKYHRTIVYASETDSDSDNSQDWIYLGLADKLVKLEKRKLSRSINHKLKLHERNNRKL